MNGSHRVYGESRNPARGRLLRLVPDLTVPRLFALVAFVGTYLGLAVGHLP